MAIGINGASEDPESTAAITYWAPAVAKWAGCSAAEIRAVIEQLDGMSY
jgi:hypothetical protein